TSVCSGSLLLAAAGLLRGYRAAAHWLARDALAALGAEGSRDRVVVDRPRVTRGGVTPGVDLRPLLPARLRGEEARPTTHLATGAAPQPPFSAGTPETAGPVITHRARSNGRFGRARSRHRGRDSRRPPESIHPFAARR